VRAIAAMGDVGATKQSEMKVLLACAINSTVGDLRQFIAKNADLLVLTINSASRAIAADHDNQG
jgi:hypothetical protein